MKKTTSIYLLLLLLVFSMGFQACNDDEDTSVDVSDNSASFAAMVNSFSLNANEKVLDNLDSVFFSIDLNNARIFNADSLPLGTRVDSLPVTITFSSVSKAEIIMPGKQVEDTTINYLQNGSAAIDFSRGYVTLHLESVNEITKMDYLIYVNVHKMKPDSLAWGDAAWSVYPTDITSPSALRALDFGGKAYCFASGASKSTLAVADNPSDNLWQTADVALPAGFDVNSIRCSAKAFYGLDRDGNLFKSADGKSWTDTGSEMNYIYAVSGNMAIGAKRNSDNSYSYITYPATTTSAVPSDAPVAATSQPVTFVSDWSSDPMILVTGGITASGNPTGATWAYDGGEWASITINPLPGLYDVTMVPYFSIKVSEGWRVTKSSALLAFGGRSADGSFSRTMYISVDRGVHWAKAGDLLQLPEAVPSLAGAQALVFEKTMTPISKASALWTPCETQRIPVWSSRADNGAGIAPITSWQTPYIYLYGGQTSDFTLNTAVWRGVINRLSFKPLQ